MTCKTTSPAARNLPGLGLATTFLATALLQSFATSAPLEGGVTVRVSVSSDGAEGTQSSSLSQISADGDRVVFRSSAPNLVRGDTNGVSDAFVHTRSTGETIRVSVATDGTQGNGSVDEVAISSDGNVVAFCSDATNLVPGDTNGVSDVFVHDLRTRETIRASVASNGNQSNGSIGNGLITLSHDGDRVAFTCDASNLAGSDNNDEPDVFLRKISAGKTIHISVNNAGEGGDDTSQFAFLSDSGNYVSFQSASSNFPHGSSGHSKIYVRDLITRTTEVVSVDEGGGPANNLSYNSSISRDGRWVAFDSRAYNLVTPDTNNFRDIFLYDRRNSTTIRITDSPEGPQANNESLNPVISDDARAIVFNSRASNLLQVDLNSSHDIIAFYRSSASFELMTQSSAGAPLNTSAKTADLSAGGRYVSFWVDWPYLVYGDENGDADVYVRDIEPSWPMVYCPAEPSTNGCVSQIAFDGTPSASEGEGFTLSCTEIRNGTWGLLIYSTDGSDDRNMLGHTLCLTNTFRRTRVQPSGGSGTPGTNCSGTFELDFNDLITEGSDSALVAGQTVWAQYFMRDPVIPPSAGGSLSNAVVFTIGP